MLWPDVLCILFKALKFLKQQIGMQRNLQFLGQFSL